MNNGLIAVAHSDKIIVLLHGCNPGRHEYANKVNVIPFFQFLIPTWRTYELPCPIFFLDCLVFCLLFFFWDCQYVFNISKVG